MAQENGNYNRLPVRPLGGGIDAWINLNATVEATPERITVAPQIDVASRD